MHRLTLCNTIAYSIRIILVRDGAVIPRARVPGGHHALVHDTLVVGGRALIVCVVSGKALATDFPQGAVILIVIGQVLITFEAVWERGERSRLLIFLAREKANVLLRNCLALEAVTSIFVNPLQLGWTLCCMNTGNETRGRGRRTSPEEIVL
jgi:hypothetical protein